MKRICGGSSTNMKLPVLEGDGAGCRKRTLDHPSPRPLFAGASCNRCELFPPIGLGAAETGTEIPAGECKIPYVRAARTQGDVVELVTPVPV